MILSWLLLPGHRLNFELPNLNHWLAVSVLGTLPTITTIGVQEGVPLLRDDAVAPLTVAALHPPEHTPVPAVQPEKAWLDARCLHLVALTWWIAVLNPRPWEEAAVE